MTSLLLPPYRKTRTIGYERNASGSLKCFGSIQVTFRSSDSDLNGVDDFHTADVKGLYFISVGTPTPVQIRMVEVSVALADADPDPGNDYINPPNPPQTLKARYWFKASKKYTDEGGLPQPYGRRHMDRFGFAAYPDPTREGTDLAFIVNEEGAMRKFGPKSVRELWVRFPRKNSIDPDGIVKPEFDAWPADPAAAGWSKLD